MGGDLSDEDFKQEYYYLHAQFASSMASELQDYFFPSFNSVGISGTGKGGATHIIPLVGGLGWSSIKKKWLGGAINDAGEHAKIPQDIEEKIKS